MWDARQKVAIAISKDDLKFTRHVEVNFEEGSVGHQPPSPSCPFNFPPLY